MNISLNLYFRATGFEPEHPPGHIGDIAGTDQGQIVDSKEDPSRQSGHFGTPGGQTEDTLAHAPCCTGVAQRMPEDLGIVIEHWNKLPDAVRVGIVAMVRASSSPD